MNDLEKQIATQRLLNRGINVLWIDGEVIKIERKVEAHPIHPVPPTEENLRGGSIAPSMGFVLARSMPETMA